MTFYLRLFTLLAILAMVVHANEYESSYDTTNCYSQTCPNVLEISKKITEQFINDDPTLAPSLLRMLFHDCFVRGCDASILLDPTPYNNETEKISVPNSSLKGFEVIDAIKAELEKECPDVVSCADILSLVARDAIVAINGPWWAVPLGRRDGKISLATEALANIPSPFDNITTLINDFGALGLSPKDLVVLSAAHTIGIGHCFIIQKRLYNFTGNGDSTDPTLDPAYAEELKVKCPKMVRDLESFVPMDFKTPMKFDDNYFGIVAGNKGLFQSDAALLDDYSTKSYIYTQLYSNGESFAKDFAESMVKLNQIGILTGSDGEIRKTCRAVNTY